jgi:indolepyruvate ferredoxin oxidoreductase beta subunit
VSLNCLITGVGGQGTVLLSRIIGAAAIGKGLEVRGTETIGMAQRGGSVVSHIRMGAAIHSPLIPQGKADLVIAFEPAEAVRVLPFLGEAGKMILLNRPVPPVSSALGGPGYEPRLMLEYLKEKMAAGDGLTCIDGETLLARCGSVRVVNTALLGAALALDLFPFTAGDVVRVLTQRIPEHFLDLNIRALELGGSLVNEKPGNTQRVH